MLDSEIRQKIEEFVYSRPRSVQEIAEHIRKSWKTVNRYVDEIMESYGTISVHVFRGGTRGALKIVYWAGVDKASKSVFQEQLEEQIILGRKKEDFSGFDIFQHISRNEKSVWVGEGKNEVDAGRILEFNNLLLSAKSQIIFFSGNLSFINLKDKKIDIFETLDGLAKKGIRMKVLCRVDIAGLENVRKILSLNFKYGKEIVEVHHREQPLRALIIDGKVFNIKEIKESTGKDRELNKKIFIYYTIKNKEWAEWLSKIFWKMFSSSIDAKLRLEEMELLKFKL